MSFSEKEIIQIDQNSQSQERECKNEAGKMANSENWAVQNRIYQRFHYERSGNDVTNTITDNIKTCTKRHTYW